ncbi:MAG: hypothetical protein Q8L37_00350, partial [Candidatus Gottesmanbacteria bacterium]|nr:hypothetical protein [Candidatus Gottesmanbacteria bacterium]
VCLFSAHSNDSVHDPSFLMTTISIKYEGQKRTFLYCNKRTLSLCTNTEVAIDRAIATNIDLVSTEANSPNVHEKPVAEAHTAMNPEELAAWMRDSGEHMMRALRVDRETYNTTVDTQALHQEIAALEAQGKRAEAQALRHLEEQGVIGFSYLYNDTRTDHEQERRATVLRERLKKPAHHSVWEMNFWVVPGTKDDAVKGLVGGTLREFAKTRSQETTTVMFADASDLAQGYQDKTGESVTLASLRDGKKLGKAEAGFQDTRVLKTLGFKRAGTIWFDQRLPNSPVDQAYTLTILKGK